MKLIKAVVLAGGRGERLKPLTDFRPKTNVPLEKRRLVDFTVSNCLNSARVDAIDVLAQSRANQLIRHIEDTYLSHEVKKPVRCQIPPIVLGIGDEFFKGTADAVRQSRNIFSEKHEIVLVLSGDHLYSTNYDKLVEYHEQTKSAITIVVQQVPAVMAARQLGVINVNEAGRPISFDEKPDAPQVIYGTNNCWANLGIYVFDAEKLKEILAECAGNDFGGDIIPFALRRAGKYPISLFEYSGYWRDVGAIPSLWQANMDLVGPAPAINLYDRRHPIYHKPRHLPSPKFINGCEIQDAIVSDGCIVAGQLRSTVISTRARIGSGSVIVESVIFDAAEIGRDVRLNRVLVDKYAKIGDGVVLGENIEQELKMYPDIQVKEGIIVVTREAELKRE